MGKTKLIKLRKEIPASWEEVLEQYIWFKQAEGLRETTIKGHRDVIRLLYSRYPDGWQHPKQAILAFMAENIKPAT